ncbi:MAG: porin family protein [Lysobacter sp.]|nr:porin family protein [Lysobacter sp.]
MNKIHLLTGALALSVLSTSAFAEGPFVRVEGGRSHLNVNGSSDNDTTWSLRGGYAFTPNVAVEGFYSNLYDKSNSVGSAKVNSFGAGVVGKYNFGPENSGFFVDGRAGLARNKVKIGVPGLPSQSDSKVKPYYGVGAGYDFNRNVGVGLNYDWNKASAFGVSGKLRTVTLGAEYRF